MEYGPVRFELCIEGIDERDKEFATKIFLDVWNSMARLLESCELTKAYQKVFDMYYPTENHVNTNPDNAYVSLFERMAKRYAIRFHLYLEFFRAAKRFMYRKTNRLRLTQRLE